MPGKKIGQTERNIARQRANLRSLADIEEETVSWFWPGMIPNGSVTVLDGDPGQGKSTITYDIAARASAGQAMPLENEHETNPVNVVLVCAEDSLPQVIKPRIRVAGGDLRRVHPITVKRRGGKIVPLTLPDGTDRIRDAIIASEARLTVVDPITAYLGERVNSHNEASVRRALEPLAEVADETGCAIVMVRHLNKDQSKKALYRGSGSIAFTGLARSGLITGVLPSDMGGDFALGQVKSNLRKLLPGALAYSIVVRETRDNGEEITGIEWHDWVSVDADTLVRGQRDKPGPAPTGQDECIAVMNELFEERDTWDSDEIIAAIKETTGRHRQTIDKAKARIGVKVYPVYRRVGGGGHPVRLIDHWEWTVKPVRLRGGDE